MTEWQDISTAPRDGTEVILCDSRTNAMVIAGWNSPQKDYPGSPTFGWQTMDGVGYMTLTFTHWMPLPTPPKEQPHD